MHYNYPPDIITIRSDKASASSIAWVVNIRDLSFFKSYIKKFLFKEYLFL